MVALPGWVIMPNVLYPPGYRTFAVWRWGSLFAAAQRSAVEVWDAEPPNQIDGWDPLTSPVAGVGASGGLYGRTRAITRLVSPRIQDVGPVMINMHR